MKKGFTFIELLAVIIVLGVVAVIAVPTFNNVVQSSRTKAFLETEKGIIRGLKNYLDFNDELYPINDEVRVVSFSTLQNEKFISKIKSPTGSDCSGYVTIVKDYDDTYQYNPYYRCDGTTINSPADEGLVLNYTFDDYQDPSENKINPNGFVGNANFSVEKLDEYKFKVTLLSMPATNSYYIQQTYIATANRPTTMSIEVLESSNPNWIIGVSGWGNITGGTGYKEGNRFIRTITHTVNWTYSISLGYVTDTFRNNVNVGDYIIVRNAQIEDKAYATPFVDGIRTATLTDYSNTGKTATISPTAPPRWTYDQQRKSGAYLFNNNIITFGTGNTFFPLNTFSISTWVKTPGLGSGMTLNGVLSITYGLTLYLNSTGTVGLRMDNGTGLPAITANRNLNDNQYHHIVGMFDGTNAKIFIDGDLIITSPFTGWTGSTRWPTNSAIIGQENNNGTIYRFNGIIDDLKIYNRALTDTQVKDLYLIEKRK